MLRVFLAVLAVVTAAAAYLLSQPWLYAVAGLLAAAAIGVALWETRPEKQPAAALGAPRDSLDDVGIMEIRPKAASAPPPPDAPVPPPALSVPEPAISPAVVLEETEAVEEAEPVAAAPVAASPETESSFSFVASEEAPPPKEARFTDNVGPVRPVAPANGSAPRPKPAPSPFASRMAVEDAEDAEDRDVMVPLLHALHAAVGAHTVCLLKQEDVALNYHIKAMVSKNGYARGYGYFSTRTPLMTARMARQEVTVMAVGKEGLSRGELGYYQDRLVIRQIALASVPVASRQVVYILAVDGVEAQGLEVPRHRTLIARFAHLIGAVLNARDFHGEAEEDAVALRPRREIIAEEIAEARLHNAPLGLALVYLNRAEAIAEAGGSAVITAEYGLANRLEEAARPRRVERFGELTYGVFFNDTVDVVETWVSEFLAIMSQEEETLAGGVSIGVAMLHDDHRTPDELRADATEALQEAYETGTCTILE